MELYPNAEGPSSPAQVATFMGPTDASGSLPRTHSRDIAAGFGATVPPKPTSPDGVCSRLLRRAAISSRGRRKWRLLPASSHGVTSHAGRARWSAPGRGSRPRRRASTRRLRGCAWAALVVSSQTAGGAGKFGPQRQLKVPTSCKNVHKKGGAPNCFQR